MMMRTPRADLFVLAAFLAAALIATAGTVDAFRQNQKPALLIQQSARPFSGDAIDASLVNHIRGGASGIDVDIESSDEEETDDEEEEEILLAPKLAKATKKAAKKAVKKSVAAAMKPKKKKSSLMKFFQIPYIVKACLNPMVLFQMTAGYWKSLYNINYMSDNAADSSQDLRSALEAKARLAGGKKPSRGRRKMKPGQAKTLSDLPVLNT